MATDLTDWSPDIMPDIPVLPTPALKVAVRNAAIEFCEKTWLWVFELDRISVVEDQCEYDLTVPDAQEGSILAIDHVKYKQDGEDDDQFASLDPLSENQSDLHDTGSWKYRTSSTPSKFYGDPNDKTKLYLFPIPTEASSEGLLVKVVLRPTVSCETLPDFLYTEHRGAIAFGALAGLFSKRSMPWFDPQQAAVNRAYFLSAIANGKTSKISGPTKRAMRVRMREFV